MVHDATSDEVFKVFILLGIASHVVRCWKRTIHCHTMVDSSLQRPAHCTNRFGFIHVDPMPLWNQRPTKVKAAWDYPWGIGGWDCQITRDPIWVAILRPWTIWDWIAPQNTPILAYLEQETLSIHWPCKNWYYMAIVREYGSGSRILADSWNFNLEPGSRVCNVAPCLVSHRFPESFRIMWECQPRTGTGGLPIRGIRGFTLWFHVEVPRCRNVLMTVL